MPIRETSAQSRRENLARQLRENTERASQQHEENQSAIRRNNRRVQNQENDNYAQRSRNDPQTGVDLAAEQETQAKLPNIDIKTNVNNFKEEVKFVDEAPTERSLRYQYKFYCPICLRYFTHILMSNCCKNYLCHFCADDIKHREQSIQSYVAHCPYSCTQNKFELTDVIVENEDELKAKLKRYTDSQQMSFYSNALQLTNKDNKSSIQLDSNKNNSAHKEEEIQIAFSPNKIFQFADGKENISPERPYLNNDFQMNYQGSKRPFQPIQKFVNSASGGFLVKDQQEIDINRAVSKGQSMVVNRSDGMKKLAENNYQREPFQSINSEQKSSIQPNRELAHVQAHQYGMNDMYQDENQSQKWQVQSYSAGLSSIERELNHHLTVNNQQQSDASQILNNIEITTQKAKVESNVHIGTSGHKNLTIVDFDQVNKDSEMPDDSSMNDSLSREQQPELIIDSKRN